MLQECNPYSIINMQKLIICKGRKTIGEVRVSRNFAETFLVHKNVFEKIQYPIMFDTSFHKE